MEASAGQEAWIEIINDDNFTAENGVTSGNGTYENPYIIENLVFDLSQNTYGNSKSGIYIAYTEAWFVIRNVTVHSGLVNISPGGYTGGHGVELYYVDNGVIEGCDFTGNLDGIKVSNCRNIEIRDNDIMRNDRGLVAASSYDLRVESNNISSNSFGNIEFNQINGARLANNTISHSTEWMGINLYSSEQCEVHGNEISFNENIGVNVGFSKDCKITNNTIVYNGIGITIYGSENIQASPNGFSFNRKNVENWDDDNGVNPWIVLALMTAIVATVIIVAVLWVRLQKKKPIQPQMPPMIDRRT